MKNGFYRISDKQYAEVNLPTRQTKHAAGYDIEAAQTITILPLGIAEKDVTMMPTGIKCKMNDNQVLKIYSRSSLGCKKGLMIPNNVGIIDSDYFNNEGNEGHIYVPLINFGSECITINKGDRIAQGVLQEYLTFDDEVEVERKGGIGSTK